VPYSITWNFGDGISGSGQHVTHTFVKSGDFNVTLSVKDASGQNVSENQLVHVTKSANGAPVQKQHLNDKTSSSVNSSNAISSSINQNSSTKTGTNSSKITENLK
jgi:PKD repeat protein